jgi:hypothetical protein
MQACLASAYFDPNVPIGSSSAVSNYLVNTIPPNGPTALRLALEGAFQGYIPDWEHLNPAKFVVPVVVAGGPPQAMDCPPNTLDAITAVASNPQRNAVNGNTHTRTFVIAFEIDTFNNTQPFDLIAQAGGTNRAFMIDGRPSAAQQFTNALEAIRRRSCMFRLPANAGDHFSLDVLTADNPTHPDVLFFVPDHRADSPGLGSACGRADHAFEMYRDPSDARMLIGCDQLCEELANGATVELLPECQTNPAVPR